MATADLDPNDFTQCLINREAAPDWFIVGGAGGVPLGDGGTSWTTCSFARAAARR